MNKKTTAVVVTAILSSIVLAYFVVSPKKTLSTSSGLEDNPKNQLKHTLVLPKSKVKFFNIKNGNSATNDSFAPDQNQKLGISKLPAKKKKAIKLTSNSIKKARTSVAFDHSNKAIIKEEEKSEGNNIITVVNNFTKKVSDTISSNNNDPFKSISEEDLSTERPTPKIMGTIPPLVGSVVDTSYSLFSAYAATCTDPKILIFDILTKTIVADNPISAKELESTTRFEFIPSKLELNLDTPNRYMLKTSGCTVSYERIITSYYKPQNLTSSTTIISKSLNSSIANEVVTLAPEKISKIVDILESKTEPTDPIDQVYSDLESDPDLQNTFNEVFESTPDVLLSSAPDVLSLTVPLSINEKQATNYSITTEHWSPTYTTAYQWIIDGTTESYSSSWDYTPSANSKRSLELVLLIGKKKDLSNEVDTINAPYHRLEYTLNVSDNYPATAAPILLSADTPSPSKTNLINIDLLTGNEIAPGIYENCETISNFAISEDDNPIIPADFTISCGTPVVQTIPYTIMSGVDGVHTIKLWGKDTNGTISSTPSTITVDLDTTPPIIEFNAFDSFYLGARSYDFKWKLTEAHATAANSFTVSFFDGTSWFALTDVPVTTGDHAQTEFTTSIALPNINTTAAKIRVSLTDILGQTSIQESETFEIKIPTFDLTPISYTFETVLSKANTTPKTFTFFNNSTVTGTGCTVPALTGANVPDFTITSTTCDGSDIGPGGSCEIVVTGTPQTKGAKSATLEVSCGLATKTTALSYLAENNIPAMGADMGVSTDEDNSVDFTVPTATDVDGDSLLYSIVTPPSKGMLTGCLGNNAELNCHYIPNANINGTDSFTYIANDGTTDALTITTVTITIAPINDAPVMNGNQVFSTNEDTPISITLSGATDIDLPAQILNYELTSPPAKGTLQNCISMGTLTTDITCDYVPTANAFGVETFSYIAFDGIANSATTSTVTININAVNDAPVLVGDQSVSTPEDTPISFDLNPASDIDGNPLTYIIVNAPTHGTVTCTGSDNRSCTYTPDLNYYGLDTFTYKANDGLADSASVTVNITISGVNDIPVMNGDQNLVTNEDTTLSITLSGASDVDIPVQPLTYKLISLPSKGILQNCLTTGSYSADLTCDYIPDANISGTDTFTYEAYDGVATSAVTSTITITINAVNDAPTLPTGQTETTAEDTALNFTLNAGTDTEGTTLNYNIISTTGHGTLTCTGGTSRDCTYTPALNYYGADSFTYNVDDGDLTSNTVTVNLTVTPVNDAPTLTATQSLSTNEDNALSFDLTMGADVDGDTLSYIITSTPPKGMLSCTGGTSTSCTYTPLANDNGTITFQYKVNDGQLDSTTATVTITVGAVNDAPTMNGNQSQSTNEDTAVNFTLLGASDIDIPANTLSYQVISAPAHGTLTNCITTGSWGTDLTCTYTPMSNFNGADSFTYKAFDETSESISVATVSISVNAVNDAPTIAATQSLSTNEDTAIAFDLNLGTDIEGSTLNYSVISTTTSGALVCTGGTSRSCTYTPSLNFNGSDTFTYKVNDGELDSAVVTATITVNAINDSPVMSGDQIVAITEDTPKVFTLLGATDVDIPANPITYKLISTPASGTLSGCINTSTWESSTSCTYTPAANYNGSITFTYRAYDSITQSATDATVTLNISAVNDAPTLPSTQAVATDEDTPLTFNLAPGADIDEETLTYNIVSAPAQGTLNCTGGTSTSCTYTPTLNHNGSVTFTYNVNDGSLSSTNATVTINIAPINDAPVNPSDMAVSTNEDTPLNINLNLGTDIETLQAALQYIMIDQPLNGTVTNCISTGSYTTDTTCTYTPNANFNGVDSFTYKTSDGALDASGVTTVTITVNAVNDAPTVATPQTFTTNEDTVLNFNLASGVDTEGDTLSYIVASTPAKGTLSCTGGTSTACSYTPASNDNGSVTFTYKANDSALDSNIASVTINITPVNDAPVNAATQTVSTPEDTVINFNITAGTDVEGDTLTYVVDSLPAVGTLNCTEGTSTACTYTPVANWNGSVTFTYHSSDSLLNSNTTTVTINVTAVNDIPTIPATQSVSTNEDTPVIFDLNAGSDIEGSTLYYSVVSTTGNGTINCSGGISRSCTYTPNANWNGTTTFTYKVNDGTDDSVNATVTVTVNPVNDAPVMTGNQTFTTNDNTGLNITLAGATDIDGGALGYKVLTSPSNGTLTNCIVTGSYGTDLTCTYTSNTNYDGTDSFTYIANDTFTDAETFATVTITVQDKTPPSAPLVALSSNQYTNLTAVKLTASSCTDTPWVLVNESTAPAAGDAGWVACTTAADAITYTINTTEGNRTLNVWSKDAHGNVSTTSTNIGLTYDQTAPSISISNIPDMRGGFNATLNWTLTDITSTSTSSFAVEYFDGAIWKSIGTTPSTEGSASAAPFDINWTTPYLNINTAKVRVSYTDRAGNSSTVESNVFTLDSIPPELTITAPAAGIFVQTSVTISGTCETGQQVDFSGDIPAAFGVACNAGTYSQLLNLTLGDGPKTIIVTTVDDVGNTTTVNRTFNRDTGAPSITRTSGASPTETKDTSVTWGGNCEADFAINITGDATQTIYCSSGTWTWTTPSESADGTYNYTLTHVDAAGNSSTLPLTWTRDNTAPVFTIGTPGPVVNNLDQMTVGGNCEGTLPITVSGDASTIFSCSSGTWSFMTPSYTTDGTRSFTFTHTDTAGNSSVITYDWTRDSSGPALTLTSDNLIVSNEDTASYNGTCEDGLAIEVTGAETTSLACTSGAWNFTTAVASTDATRSYTFKQTNGIGNSTTTTATWIRETDPPTISSISTTAGATTTSNFIPISLSASSANTAVNITHFCMSSNDSVAPTNTSDCWVAVNSPQVALSPAPTLNLSNYMFLLGWAKIDYSVYVWVMDNAGNISELTNTGAGTAGIDLLSLAYDPGLPPVVSNVIAGNVDNSANPPTVSETEVPAGSDVYIRYTVSDDAALPAGAISIYYTEDEINFSPVVGAEALNANTNYSCPTIVLGAGEGCYKWSTGSPLNTGYKVRVKVADAGGLSAQSISNPLNSARIKIIAGNTESGLGGSAASAMFYTRRAGSEADPGTLVVSDDGRIFVADYKRGILVVDPADGKQNIFIPQTGTSSGDGGLATSATLNYAVKIALDYQNRLLILDRNRIRRVDLNLASPTIETIIGGGSVTADTAAPLDVQIYSHSTNSWTARGAVFFPMPNGDIYFQSEYAVKNTTTSTWRYRIYKKATNQVISKYIGGTGDYISATQDLSKCQMQHLGFVFDLETSQVTGITAIVKHHADWPECVRENNYSGERYTRAEFDPATGLSLGTATDDSYRYYYYFAKQGLDGKHYVMYSRNRIVRRDGAGQYTTVLGTGTRGQCVDGTVATSCNIDVQDYFINTKGDIYFIDGGTIRTVDKDGKVLTLMGQRRDYGDGVNALNARFDAVYFIDQVDSGKIFVGDNYRIKEFDIEGNINILMGNGNSQSSPSTSVDPKTIGMYSSSWWVADPTTGDVYLRGNYERLYRFNYSTKLYENIVGLGTVDYWNADGEVGTNVKSNGNQSYLLPVGFANNQVVLSRMKYLSADAHYEDFMLKAYDVTDSFRQSHLAGTNDPATTYTGGYQGICASGSVAATCKVPYYTYYGRMTWDNVGGRWIFARNIYEWDSYGRQIWGLTPGGTLDLITTLPRDIENSYKYVRRNGKEYVYYCGPGNRLFEHNITDSIDNGQLTWPLSTLYCQGENLLYNSTRDSLIFPFNQNGLSGVAEYYLQ